LPHPNPGPLEGIRVVDLTQALSGPLCTAHLAVLGAEVIKIERPDSGDVARHNPPFAGRRGVTPDAALPDDISTCALKRNRDKKSVALDLSSTEGLDLLKRLVAKADVVVENFRPGVAASLGIDHASLMRIRPDLVCCSISGFGSSGPYRNWSAMDTLVQAMAGVMAVTGAAGGPPTKTGLNVGDILPALFASTAILAALRRRDRTGAGESIEVAMYDCLVSLLWDEPLEYYVERKVPSRSGNRFLRFAPWNTYAARDGHIVLCSGQQVHFATLCKLMDRPDLVEDERFSTMARRIEHVDEIDAEIGRWVAQHDRADLISRCQAAGVVCGPVNELVDVVNDPGIAARRMVKPLLHPVFGAIANAGAPEYPVRFGSMPVEFAEAAPSLGQHTQTVLEDLLGLSRAEIDALAQRGVVRRAAMQAAGHPHGEHGEHG
jgi:crotonobetainyl-CoA:carnitine CoA-transferase CaiB-like acyl-CoA transferase